MNGTQILFASLFALFSAQVIKFLLAMLQQGKLNFRPLVGTGGMPSSHTALTVCLTVLIGLSQGWDSPLFAMCVIYTMIVMYDSAGVRRAAGRQAMVLNKIIDELTKTHQVSEERLKELLGHTPMEVFGGLVYGILVAILYFNYFTE